MKVVRWLKVAFHWFMNPPAKTKPAPELPEDNLVVAGECLTNATKAFCPSNVEDDIHEYLAEFNERPKRPVYDYPFELNTKELVAGADFSKFRIVHQGPPRKRSVVIADLPVFGYGEGI